MPEASPSEPEANHHTSQKQRCQESRRAALGHRHLGCHDLGELPCIQPLLLLEHPDGRLAAELYRGTLFNRIAEDALDIRGNFRRVRAGPDGNSDQGSFVSQARRAALHAFDLIQSRQHGREPLRSAGPGPCQSRPHQPKDFLSAAIATAHATYGTPAPFRKARSQKQRPEPDCPTCSDRDAIHGPPRHQVDIPRYPTQENASWSPEESLQGACPGGVAAYDPGAGIRPSDGRHGAPARSA
jgi:hypothetical protein